MELNAWSEAARDGRLEDALRLALEARERVPERADWTWYPVAALQARLGRQAEAAATLREALDRGHLWRVSLLDAIELDLDQPEVAAVVAEARERVARLHLEPKLLVAEPPAARGLRPLLLAFHGATGNAELELAAWRPATGLGYTVAAAQSSQPSTPTGFCWDPPEARIKQDVNAIAGRLPPHARLLLAGFSQGAWLALRLALEGARLPAPGAVLVGPFVADLERLPPAARRLRVVILAGADDPYALQLSRLAERLGRHGHHVELHVVEGLDHAYPADFAERIPTLLAAATRVSGIQN